MFPDGSQLFHPAPGEDHHDAEIGVIGRSVVCGVYRLGPAFCGDLILEFRYHQDIRRPFMRAPSDIPRGVRIIFVPGLPDVVDLS